MTNATFSHLSVLPEETIACLAPHAGEIYLDGTVGGGGHARLILEASAPDGRLIGLDRDPDALQHAAEILAPFGDRATLKHASFADVAEVLDGTEALTPWTAFFSISGSLPGNSTRRTGVSPFARTAPSTCAWTRRAANRRPISSTIAPKRNWSASFASMAKSAFPDASPAGLSSFAKTTPFTRTTRTGRSWSQRCPWRQHSGDASTRRRESFKPCAFEVNGELEQVKRGIREAFQRLRSRRAAGDHLVSFTGRPHRQAILSVNWRRV